MAYLDDKMEQIDQDKRKTDDTVARASLDQLSKRWGVVGGLYWRVEKKAPKQIKVNGMDGLFEVWDLEEGQSGSYKDKMYRRTK